MRLVWKAGLYAALAWLCVPAARAAHPIVPGFERMRVAGKLDGRLLLGELNCVSCHAAGDDTAVRKPAPVLDRVGERVRVGYLRKFLSDPQGVKPGTTMPNLFAGDPQRAEKVEALVHFLAGTGALKQERPDAKAASQGRQLYREVGCAVCHGARDAAGLQEKGLPATAVPLGDLKAKYTISSLAAFLDNPLQVRPGGRMPHIVSGKEAKTVAQYLLQGIAVALPTGKGSTTYAYYEGEWEKLPDFHELKPATRGTAGAFDAGVAKRDSNFAIVFEGFFKVEREGEYRFSTTSDDGSRLLIDGKPVVDNDGVHAAKSASGAIKLAKGIHQVAVEFFQAGGEIELGVHFEGPGLGQQEFASHVASTRNALEKPAEPSKRPAGEDDLEPRPDLVERGKALFASSGCANCHTLNSAGKPLLAGPPLKALKADRGCLAAAPASGIPAYSLDEGQRAALVAAIRQLAPLAHDPAAVLERTLVTFNCYACHTRNKVGGPDETTNKFFVTKQPEMGDEARVPPPLDGAGAKLNPDYLKQILDQGAHDRPYMHTHMPGFGAANVGQAAEALAALDQTPRAPAVHFSVPDAKVKSAGRFLVGAKAFSCIKCHTFAGHKAEGVQGIDMTLMTRRLRHDWFVAYLTNPQRIRPGTRMPAAWPESESALPLVLDGQSATQIEAVWVYLKDSGSAQLPAGLGQQFLPLIPHGNAILYRNFIEGAGPRAIGVGYPERLNLAFDANEMRLALLWQGDFIDAARHWTDRGAGFEGPLGENILHLHAGAPFAVLSSADEPWPTGRPRELGWKFKGYHLTPDDRPTFHYAFGDLKIEDFPNPTGGKEPTLRRTLALSAPSAPENLFFRAAVGNKIESLGDGWYRIDGWKMKIESTAAARVRQSAGRTELLVPVQFKDGHARIVQEFVW